MLPHKAATEILFIFPSGRYITSLLSIFQAGLSVDITGVNPAQTYLFKMIFEITFLLVKIQSLTRFEL